MDLNTCKKALTSAVLCAAAIGSPVASAATASTTVDINFPTLLIMYHYDTIDLDLDATSLGTHLVTAATGCSGDVCTSQGDITRSSGPISANTNVDASFTAPAFDNNSATFTLQNAVGVRGLGCTDYDAQVAEGASTSAGVTVTAGAIAGIDGVSCSLGMTTGDLAFAIDFDTVNPATAAAAIFDVTITGNP